MATKCLLSDIMGWNQAGARLSRRDVQELNSASEALADAAHTIQQMRPQWGPAVVRLLVMANDVVVRVQNKGAEAFAKYLEKHGLKELPGETEAEGAEDDPDQGRKTQPEEAD